MMNSRFSTVVLLALSLGTLVMAQSPASPGTKPPAAPVKKPDSTKPAAIKPAEDISGMYSFLGEGEFVQINLEETGVSGYISRRGDIDSDRGEFLDQFFSEATVQDHDVSFTTRPLHGVWFEFKGRFDRGPAKSKSEDGYYILRGTLIQFAADSNHATKSRSREVEFKLLGQPPDEQDMQTHR
jgi:hypothetical protein